MVGVDSNFLYPLRHVHRLQLQRIRSPLTHQRLLPDSRRQLRVHLQRTGSFLLGIHAGSLLIPRHLVSDQCATAGIRSHCLTGSPKLVHFPYRRIDHLLLLRGKLRCLPHSDHASLRTGIGQQGVLHSLHGIQLR